jgi:long-chain fatty acid transport protein
MFAYRNVVYSRPEAAIERVLERGDQGTGTPANAVSANAGNASLLNFPVSPFIGASTDLGVPNLAIGGGFYVPMGGSAAWDKNAAFVGNDDLPGAQDGVQRWWSVDGTMRYMYASGAIAYRFPKARLSLGVSGNYVMSEVSTVRARNASARDDTTARTDGGDSLQEGRSYLQVEGQSASLGAGVIWQPTDTTWLGVAYQSQPGFGEQRLRGTLHNALGTAPSDATDVELLQSLPDVVRLGVRYRPGKTELRLSGEYVRWSLFDRQCILDANMPDRKCVLDGSGAEMPGAKGIVQNLHRSWQDAFGARVGASRWITDGVELSLGAGYDGNAVPDRTMDPSLFDMDKFSGSLGLRFTMAGGALTLLMSYTHIYFMPREVPVRPVTPGAAAAATVQGVSAQPDPAGTYSQAAGLLNVGLGYAF